MTFANPFKSRLNFKRFLRALWLADLFDDEPAYWLPILFSLAYLLWMSSPYLIYNTLGMPTAGMAPRYVGTLKVVGVERYSRSGIAPPRYYVSTSNGDVEFHCGVLPSRQRCFYSRQSLDGIHPIEVGIDHFWGIDYIKFPDQYSQHNEVKPESAEYYRNSVIREPMYAATKEEKAVFKPNQYWTAFAVLNVCCLVYVVLFFFALLSKNNR